MICSACVAKHCITDVRYISVEMAEIAGGGAGLTARSETVKASMETAWTRVPGVSWMVCPKRHDSKRTYKCGGEHRTDIIQGACDEIRREIQVVPVWRKNYSKPAETYIPGWPSRHRTAQKHRLSS